MNKKAVVALLLSVIPGLGHAYAGHAIRCIVYLFICTGSLGIALLIAISNLVDELSWLVFIAIVVALFVWLINIVDMIIMINSDKFKENNGDYASIPMNRQAEQHYTTAYTHTPYSASTYRQTEVKDGRDEKNVIVLLSIIPGLGHLRLGFVERGMSIMITSVVWFIIIVALMNVPGLALAWLLLLILPIFFIFSIMDAQKLYMEKERGDDITAPSIYVDMDRYFKAHRSNKSLAILVAIVPGAGHLLLGRQQKGIQLMGTFVLFIFLLNYFNFKFIVFVVPMLMLYSMLDTLQHVNAASAEAAAASTASSEAAAVSKRWIGFGLIAIGIVVLMDGILSFMLKVTPQWADKFLSYKQYLSDVIAICIGALTIIIIGFRMLFRRYGKK